jgi:hypothetical protein
LPEILYQQTVEFSFHCRYSSDNYVVGKVDF